MKKPINSKELNKILTKTLKDIRKGNINLDSAKTIALVADKINKNNLNAIQYKKVTSHKTDLTFFEGE